VWDACPHCAGGYLELAVELGRKLNPFRVWIQLTAQAFQLAQEKSHAGIDERRSREVGTVTELVGRALVVELQPGIFGDAEVTGGEA
jgi:hypothetical protein